MRKKLMAVFGTRPEAIKMCPVVNTLKSRKRFEIIVVVTGQHRELLDGVLQAFSVEPDYDLAIMQERQTLSDVTKKILSGLEEILEEECPELVLVHGDTTTAFSTALACFYRKIPVAHVEAGLRTDNIFSPFPEEFNRRAISLVSCLHFAPTQLARERLLAEGKAADTVFVTGNTVIDALRMTICPEFSHRELSWSQGSRLILLTAHRRESIGEPMRRIFRAVRRIVQVREEVKVLFPIHKNPEIRVLAEEILGGMERIHIIEPLDVAPFHNFMSRSSLILTDSGGIQEEAAALGKPVLVLREATERQEGLRSGSLMLVGTDECRIFDAVVRMLSDPEAYARSCGAENPYGDGHASDRIADILEEQFEKE